MNSDFIFREFSVLVVDLDQFDENLRTVYRVEEIALAEARYNSSSFVLAQGVLRKNVKLDLMLGSFLKHLISMFLLNSSQP